jgi:hypothetical protein
MMPFDQAPRSERTHGLKSEPDMGEKQALYNLLNSPAWPILLDVLERSCIEQETRLINCDVADTERIIAEHRMSKAFWQIFVQMQKTVVNAAREFAGLEPEKPRTEIEQILSLEGIEYGGPVGQ